LAFYRDRFSATLKIFQGISIEKAMVFILLNTNQKLFFNQIKRRSVMTILKRNGNLQSQVPRLFDDFFNRDIFNWGLSNYSDTNTTIPAVNIKETADNYEVQVAAPGMTKSDFNVELEGNTLTISSEKQSENEQNQDFRYTTKEFSYQSFSRTFTLQKEVVDTEKIRATYENGLLNLTIPKKEEARKKGPRRIEIS